MCRCGRDDDDAAAAASVDAVTLGGVVVVWSLWAGHANGRCAANGICTQTMFTFLLRELGGNCLGAVCLFRLSSIQ